MNDPVANIPLKNLRLPRNQLRPILKDTVGYLEMRDTIAQGGLLTSISVCETTQPDIYEIIDGLHRFSCFEDLKLESIPCIIKSNINSDADFLAAQIKANAIRLETKPAEYARHLKRLQKLDPRITASVMSRQVGKSVSWIKKQLLLTDLTERIQKAIDRDEVPLTNAYALAKVPEVYQEELLDRAKYLPVAEFRALTTTIIQNVQLAIKSGKLENWYIKNFKPQPFLKPLAKVLAELQSLSAGAKTVTEENLKTPIQGWKEALKWAASLDVQSVEHQRKLHENRHAQKKIERQNHVNELDSEDTSDP